MKSLQRNLPNEHGGWVLLIVGLVVGVAINPGPWQIAAAVGWLGLFFARVPVVRLLDGRRGTAEWLVAGCAFTAATLGFLPLLMQEPRSVAWAAVAMLPGAVFVLARRRRFLRSILGEMLSAVAMTPIIPSIAVAGAQPLERPHSIWLAVAMAIYMAASVFRVRAVARTGRDRASTGTVLAGTAFLPAAAVIAWAAGYWSDAVVLATLPAILIGIGLALYARRHRLALMTVGIYETVAVIAFAVGLIAQIRG